MRCRRATMAITERTLGRLDRETRDALRTHLRRCRRCAAEARAETWIAEGLAALGQAPPRAVDVRGRLVAEIGGLPPPRHDEVPAAQLGWAALVATAVGGVLLGWLWFLGPQIPQVAAQVALLLEALGTTLASIAAALLPLLALPRTLVAALADLVAGSAAFLGRLQPLAIGVVALGYAGVACTIVYVVGREFRERTVVVTGEGRTR